MARDESKRRDFRLSQLDDSQIRKGGYDKINKEPTVMYRCPECGHRAFQLSPRSGWYNCWACGVWGQEPRGLFQDSGFKFQGSGFKFQGSGSKVQDSGIIAGAEHTETRNLKPETRASSEPLLSDYVSLPFDVLSRIQDLSLEEQVSGAQFNVRQYLEQQKIPLQLAAKMNVGVATRAVKTKDDSADAKPKEHSCIVYRNVVDGFCCNAKYRAVSAKGFDQSSAFTPCAPYNIDCINPRRVEGLADITLYITEGEKDCLTLLGLGFIHVISAANGSQTDHAQSFGAFGEWLRPVRTVVVVGDQDMPGRKMADALADYFANKTVRVARWDQRYLGKDISEVYQLKGEDVARALVLDAEVVARQDIEDYDTPEAQRLAIESGLGHYDHGYDVGIGPITNSHFRLAECGGLAIFTGTPGTGKTDFLNFLSMSLINQRRSHVCYCSFETPDKFRHAGDLAQIWAGASDLTALTYDEVRPFAEVVMSHITHIKLRREKPTPELILRKAESVLDLHPSMEYLIIDPYLYISMTEGRGVSETDAIKSMLTTLQDWAHAHRVWIFLVAHPRKLKKDDGTNELEEIDYYTIAGSANWANVADFVVSLKRTVKSNCDYTRMSVLKVRDQKICVPGDVFFNRQSCARYDERPSELDAIAGKGPQATEAWETIIN